jgi:hypothetical protein
MREYIRLLAAIGVCLLLSNVAFGLTLTTSGIALPSDSRYVAYGTPGSPPDVAPTGSYLTWWHDGGAPYLPGNLTTDANDDFNYFPDKNHDVTSWNQQIAPPSLISSYTRVLDNAQVIVSSPYAHLFGDYSIGGYQDLRSATDHVFPDGTQGAPLEFHGDNGNGSALFNHVSGVTFDDVKDSMLVAFFSSDKNDGFINVMVNGVSIDNIDTWCQGWWYFTLSGMDATAPNKVTLETRYNYDNSSIIPSPHINTLDLDNTSDNWKHILPGQEGYPYPDDFHIFYIAYNPTSNVPEPVTLTLFGLGVAGSAWLRYAKRRRAK